MTIPTTVPSRASTISGAGMRSRLSSLLAVILLGAFSMSIQAGSSPGMVVLASDHSVAQTLDRLESLLKEKGVLIFARIDFSGDAMRAGLDMRPEQLLIFGSPKAGTPLMRAVPTVGLDLPLKALVWEDAEGKTWLAYNDPKYIVQRHAVESGLSANLAAVIPLLERAAAQ